MNTYEIKGSCMYSGASSTQKVAAESEEKAIKIALNRGISMKSIELIEADLIIKEPVKQERKIVDAEELLFEMDMTGSNSISIKEGFSEKTTYSREEVLKSIKLP